MALYGLYFDTGKAEIKPSSEPALKQIADLLKKQPSLDLYVVGHTDDMGSLKSNMALSKTQTNAVVQRLIRAYQIPANRLQAQGVGPLSPVATNDTEDGRALNRRVELVKTGHRMSSKNEAVSTRSRQAGVPSFDIKQDAVMTAHGMDPPQRKQPRQPHPINPPRFCRSKNLSLFPMWWENSRTMPKIS